MQKRKVLLYKCCLLSQCHGDVVVKMGGKITVMLFTVGPPNGGHMSLVTCHLSHVTCHMPHVTCHMSNVTCHMSLVTCHAYENAYLLQYILIPNKMAQYLLLDCPVIQKTSFLK